MPHAFTVLVMRFATRRYSPSGLELGRHPLLTDHRRHSSDRCAEGGRISPHLSATRRAAGGGSLAFLRPPKPCSGHIAAAKSIATMVTSRSGAKRESRAARKCAARTPSVARAAEHGAVHGEHHPGGRQGEVAANPQATMTHRRRAVRRQGCGSVGEHASGTQPGEERDGPRPRHRVLFRIAHVREGKRPSGGKAPCTGVYLPKASSRAGEGERPQHQRQPAPASERDQAPAPSRSRPCTRCTKGAGRRDASRR